VSVDTSKLTTEFNQYNRRTRNEPENTTTTVAGLIFTTPHCLQYYEKNKKTPLSAHNISNTSAHSGSHAFAVGSSSKGRFLIKKQAGNWFQIFHHQTDPQACIRRNTRKEGRRDEMPY